MATLQVKSIDDQLYEALGRRAAMENRSINQEVIHIIKQYLATPANKHIKQNEQFLQLCGSWHDDRSAATIAQSIRDERGESKHRDIEL